MSPPDFHAAIERRSCRLRHRCSRRHASPVPSPVPGTAARRAWARGFPSMLRRGISHRLAAHAPPQVGMDHAALDRAGTHDRHFHHQVVEALRASAAAACSSARAIRSGTRPRCRRPGSSRRSAGRRWESWRCRSRSRDAARTRSNALRMQVSMPSARQSTLSSFIVSRSSLSHWMMVRSSIAAFSTGTSVAQRRIGDHEAADVLRQVARDGRSALGHRQHARDQRIVADRIRLRQALLPSASRHCPSRSIRPAARSGRPAGRRPWPRRAPRSCRDSGSPWRPARRASRPYLA